MPAHRLVFHPFASRGASEVSPFFGALDEMVTDAPLRLISPYITPSIIASKLPAAMEWRLITDVKELLRSCPSAYARAACLNMIRQHAPRIRRLDGVHAKTIIGKSKLFLGSANLTNAGFMQRDELSIISDDLALRQQAAQWFDDLWSIAAVINIDALTAYAQQLKNLPQSHPSGDDLLEATPKVFASSGASPKEKWTQEDDDKRAKSVRQWLLAVGDIGAVHRYLDLLDSTLRFLEAAPDDPRIALTMVRPGCVIALTINNRYTLYPKSKTEYNRIRVLLSAQDATHLKRKKLVIDLDSYESHSKTEQPPVVGEAQLQPQLHSDVRSAMHQALATELDKAKATPNRKYHDTLLWKLVRDRPFRAAFLK